MSIEEPPGQPVFKEYTQSVWSDALVLEWDDFFMTQEDWALDCGFPAFEVLSADGQALDMDLFSHEYDWDRFMHILTIQTDDMSKVGTYNIIVKAYNEEYPENFVTKPFDIIVDMSAC